MTAEEKQYLRDLKTQTEIYLQQQKQNYSKWQYVWDTDARLLQYVKRVTATPDEHNLYELLSIKRFFSLLGKYSWNEKRVKHFIKFHERVPLSGTHGRQTYKLTEIQTFIFSNMFGFELKDGRRLIRNAYWFVPRKFSKTTSSAVLVVYDMLFGDNNAQAFVGANSYNQAKICFDEVRNIMFSIDPCQKHFKINREKITFKAQARNSFAQCLAANARTQDGLFASFVVMDEYAQAKDTLTRSGAALKNVLTSSMGPRLQPMTVVITTASEVLDGPFVKEFESVKKILRGEMDNDRVFAAIFTPDIDDKEDDPKTWHKVQPHLGITVTEEFYKESYKDALLSEDNMLTFRTKLLNIFARNEGTTWLTSKAINNIIGSFDINTIQNRPIAVIAFDLSVHDDFSAVSYAIYSEKTKRFYIHTDYYFPAGAIEEHPNKQLYKTWVKQGFLKLCKGDCIDVRQIAEDIISKTDKLNIIRIGYDSYKAKDLVNILSTAGAKNVLTPYSQTYGNFNLAVESFEMLTYNDPPAVELNPNPINVFCFSNCIIDTDRLENKKPIKQSQYQKIDGAITSLMCIGLLSTYER